MMEGIDEITRKLFVLQNYDRVFMGDGVRQLLPRCCGRQFDLSEFLKIRVKPLELEINGKHVTMFEVTCPECGRTIPPEWN